MVFFSSSRLLGGFFMLNLMFIYVIDFIYIFMGFLLSIRN